MISIDCTRPITAPARLSLWAKALALGGGVFEAVPIFQRLAGRSSHADLFVKAAVDSHSTATNPDLAFARLGRPFLDLVAKQTVLGRLSGTVPIVPYLPSPVMSTTVLADFVAEASPMPAVRLDSDLVMMSPSKLGIIVGIPQELLQSSDSRATTLFERHLQRVVRDGEDARCGRCGGGGG